MSRLLCALLAAAQLTQLSLAGVTPWVAQKKPEPQATPDASAAGTARQLVDPFNAIVAIPLITFDDGDEDALCSVESDPFLALVNPTLSPPDKYPGFMVMTIGLDGSPSTQQCFGPIVPAATHPGQHNQSISCVIFDANTLDAAIHAEEVASLPPSAPDSSSITLNTISNSYHENQVEHPGITPPRPLFSSKSPATPPSKPTAHNRSDAVPWSQLQHNQSIPALYDWFFNTSAFDNLPSVTAQTPDPAIVPGSMLLGIQPSHELLYIPPKLDCQVIGYTTPDCSPDYTNAGIDDGRSSTGTYVARRRRVDAPRRPDRQNYGKYAWTWQGYVPSDSNIESFRFICNKT